MRYSSIRALWSPSNFPTAINTVTFILAQGVQRHAYPQHRGAPQDYIQLYPPFLSMHHYPGDSNCQLHGRDSTHGNSHPSSNPSWLQWPHRALRPQVLKYHPNSNSRFGIRGYPAHRRPSCRCRRPIGRRRPVFAGADSPQRFRNTQPLPYFLFSQRRRKCGILP